MAGTLPTGNDFLDKSTKIIEENISNEQFGVSELAEELGMSRSNLLRKVKNLTRISASQFIRQVRLQKAMNILKQSSLTVSEVAYQVGFSSPSYFIKCFRDYYGYPPGEVGKGDAGDLESSQSNQSVRIHQLAAIMFTDIQGYTALMQRDETKAIEFRNRHREVFNSITKKFNGRILQYYGDGTLSTFSSANDAVRCGIEMQLAFRKEPQIPVRIGIHTGDIIVGKDEIIGDGVNIASRIESLATAGSVFISEKVYDEVKNQSGIQTASMGIYELKNVDKPMEVFAIANPGLELPGKDKVTGKVKNNLLPEISKSMSKKNRIRIKWALILLAVASLAYVIYTAGIFNINSQAITSPEQTIREKSIAVLPFINDSNDSTNVYFINGLMESTLNNLQKIKDLRVISRTSVEKYRNNPKTIPEIARELDANYFVEGSGQKIGNQILLNVQLIDARSDQHLWSEQYSRELKDIFKLQMEVAKSIADEIEVIITPDEIERISKPPTEDLIAYDYFLKGRDLMNRLDRDSIRKAIPYFEKAVEQDPGFARAYAAMTIAYYFMDEGHAEKRYTDRINELSDKALLLDAQLPQSLIARALFYMQTEEYNSAIPYFEKALEYHPNNDLVLIFLIDLYVNYLPDTEKYLEYALRGLQIDISSYDSIITSINFLHISNAFIQSGFIEEAEKYINKSLEYQPDNLYSAYVKAFILYAKNRDLQQTKVLLTEALKKDTTRLDIMQERGKISYYLRDYEEAFHYYKKYIEITEAWKLDIYQSENAKIGLVLEKMGMAEESEKYFTKFREYADNNQTIYKHSYLALYYGYRGDVEKALQHLRLFSEEEHYHYWSVIFIPMDPLVDSIRDHPEFGKIMKKIENNFWAWHKQIRSTLERKDLI
jgi:class 3 adenylate cyclase/TolB-like protein